MKLKTALLLSLIAFSGFFPLTAQNIPQAQVPARIPDSLVKRFPGAQNVNWSRAGANYEAKFSRNGKPVEATYNSSGQWQKIELGWLSDSLRLSVRNTLNQGNPGYQTQSVTRVLQRGKAPVNIVVLEKSGTIRKVEIDDSGKVLKTD